MPGRSLPSLYAVRAFEAAARHLSMTHAASELHVTPGAVSRLVRRLEADLSAVLFIRRATGLELTPVGRTMAEGAREALDRVAEAATGVRLRHHRRLAIGVYSHFLSRVLLPLLPRLRAVHPDLDVDVHASTSPLDLLPGRFDAAIVVAGARKQMGLVMRPLMPITTVPVAAPRRLKDGPIDFARVTLLHTRARPEDWRRWLDHAGLGAIPVRGGSTFDGVSLALEAAAADLGLAIAIEGLLGPDLAAGRLAIAHPARRPTHRNFVLQYDARLAEDPSLAIFADWLCEQLHRSPEPYSRPA
ncbi:LysR family transcriptional regulator [Roseococcus sp. SYP-B2431]|uniref:LysR substrate-binding domain-containing protein n=1 Tax=Roseococcus sp. SYP-B2431 TaxID=2496640 RepID=UPI00103DB4CB|nr:LysR substrate-binding domain-containing protein [Roseococcus sp. SYP-B2431]TCH98338.1 LysR family transcriptional regulator [Roseococcus sp. SYP-B2431]